MSELMSESVVEVSGFAAMGLDPRLMNALGYTDPTPIQREAIPVLLEGKDLVGLAGTGTGKTAAFALPILHRLRSAPSQQPGVAVLILVPTRELAIQVARAVKTYGKPVGIEVLAVYGGTGYADQIRAIRRGVEIVVATPGRALDLIKKEKLPLDAVTTVVLDEADEMLNMGFAEDMDAILSRTPKDRQTMLFSATMPPRIEEIAKRHLRKPVRVQVAKELPADGEIAKVRQTAFILGRENRSKALGRILEMERPTSAIIFCRTRSDADGLVETLTRGGFRPLALHGGLTQHQRDDVMGRFRSGAADMLVATDIAARGLDIAHLSHVINFDLPTDPDQYVHRIGRVGRAGRAGVAITLATAPEKFGLNRIERATRQKITVVPVPSEKDLAVIRLEQMRRQLREELVKNAATDDLRGLVEELGREFAPADVAAAALSLLRKPNLQEPSAPEVEAGLSEEPGPREFKREPRRSGLDATEERMRVGRRPTNRGMAKIYFGIGRDAGVSPRDMVGAIANETGIPGQDIGVVDLTDRFALVEVPSGAADHVIEAMQGVRIRGRKVMVRADRPPMRTAGPRGRMPLGA
ncbi:MAG TPA: DEAD/DEAH box helicase [Planctomycetia bacterium]|nr:DEAD/DEAH box helicase [Planctomycetia bacterium]